MAAFVLVALDAGHALLARDVITARNLHSAFVQLCDGAMFARTADLHASLRVLGTRR